MTHYTFVFFLLPQQVSLDYCPVFYKPFSYILVMADGHVKIMLESIQSICTVDASL